MGADLGGSLHGGGAALRAASPRRSPRPTTPYPMAEAAAACEHFAAGGKLGKIVLVS
ncbi:MAG TPA: hypothetical protein VHA73_06260 [Acidimicrobiales bacterium]|nr:hypothetical protein [Acidimicrobiales bacterium]